MQRLLPMCFFALVMPVLAQSGDDPKDPKNWTPVKIPGKQKAPEFADIEEWLSSKPLSVKELKGKVLVIHFMAFG